MEDNKLQAKSPLEDYALCQAEERLHQASVALQPYGDFDSAPGPLLWALKEAADKWTWVQNQTVDDDDI